MHTDNKGTRLADAQIISSTLGDNESDKVVFTSEMTDTTLVVSFFKKTAAVVHKAYALSYDKEIGDWVGKLITAKAAIARYGHTHVWNTDGGCLAELVPQRLR